MADAVMSLGVIVERRKIDNPWQDYAWRPIAIVPNSMPTEGWKELHSGENWVHFHAATLDLELFRGETEGYKTNLSQSPPQIFVVLRPGETAEEMEVEPFHVTACPYEAMGYYESGDEIVEGVLMPEELMAWVQTFIDAYHVDEPFLKRRNKRHKDREQQKGPASRRGRV